MNQIKVFVADPMIPAAVASFEEGVNNFKRAHPKVKVIYLQSGTTVTHVLTAIAEWDDETVTPPAGGSPPHAPVLARRTGMGRTMR